MHINKVTKIGINIVTHIFLLTLNGENRMIKNEIYLAHPKRCYTLRRFKDQTRYYEEPVGKNIKMQQPALMRIIMYICIAYYKQRHIQAAMVQP